MKLIAGIDDHDVGILDQGVPLRGPNVLTGLPIRQDIRPPERDDLLLDPNTHAPERGLARVGPAGLDRRIQFQPLPEPVEHREDRGFRPADRAVEPLVSDEDSPQHLLFVAERLEVVPERLHAG